MIRAGSCAARPTRLAGLLRILQNVQSVEGPPNEPTSARRPIAVRSSAWASLVSRALIDIGLTPNQVSALSIVFAACAAVALAGSSHLDGGWRIAALVTCAICIQLRLLCNLFDGMMAIEGGQRTPLGDLYNDVPDRIADPVILIAAGVATGKLALGLWLGWLAALLAVLTAYVRVLGAASGAGHDFTGPMAKQHRMASSRWPACWRSSSRSGMPKARSCASRLV